jgi:hypothetical protein
LPSVQPQVEPATWTLEQRKFVVVEITLICQATRHAPLLILHLTATTAKLAPTQENSARLTERCHIMDITTTREFPPLYTATGDARKDRLQFFHLIEKLKVTGSIRKMFLIFDSAFLQTQKRTGWVDNKVGYE